MLQEAIEWLSKHPNVQTGGIGTLGLSKGSDVAISCAIISQQVSPS